MSFLAASAVALSLLQPDGNSCRWSRHDLSPNAKPVVLATIAARCDQVEIAFSTDRRRALALVQAMNGKRAQVMAVDAVKGGPVALPELPAGWFEAVAFDDRGRATALGVKNFHNEGPDAAIRDEEKETLTVRGKTYPLPRYPGAPALAHAYTLIDSKWRVTETAATTSEAGGAAGTSVLAAAKLVARAKAARQEMAGKQLRLTTSDGIVLFADVSMQDGPDGEESIPTTPLRRAAADGAPLPGLAKGVVVFVTSHNGYLLVETWAETKALHVFEGKTGKAVLTVPGIEAAQLY